MPSDNQAFFEQLNELTGEAESGKALYYKIQNYWVLPAQSSRTMTDYRDIINDEDTDKEYWRKIEERFDESVLYFLAKSEKLRKFKDFEKLVKTIYETSPNFMSEKNRPKMLNDELTELEGFPDFLYYRSKSMLNLIERL